MEIGGGSGLFGHPIHVIRFFYCQIFEIDSNMKKYGFIFMRNRDWNREMTSIAAILKKIERCWTCNLNCWRTREHVNLLKSFSNENRNETERWKLQTERWQMKNAKSMMKNESYIPSEASPDFCVVNMTFSLSESPSLPVSRVSNFLIWLTDWSMFNISNISICVDWNWKSWQLTIHWNLARTTLSRSKNQNQDQKQNKSKS
jgi:hypothetical protein